MFESSLRANEGLICSCNMKMCFCEDESESTLDSRLLSRRSIYEWRNANKVGWFLRYHLSRAKLDSDSKHQLNFKPRLRSLFWVITNRCRLDINSATFVVTLANVRQAFGIRRYASNIDWIFYLAPNHKLFFLVLSSMNFSSKSAHQSPSEYWINLNNEQIVGEWIEGNQKQKERWKLFYLSFTWMEKFSPTLISSINIVQCNSNLTFN